jgi:hypothetical protein
VAWAEVTAVQTLIGVWNATQMGADTDCHQPLSLLYSCCIFFRISHRAEKCVVLSRRLNHIFRSPSDENGLSSPPGDEILTGSDRLQIDVYHTSGNNVSGGPESVNNLNHSSSN